MELSIKRAIGGILIMLILLLVFQLGFWNYQKRSLASDIRDSLGADPDKTKLAQVFFEYRDRTERLERLRPILNFNFGYNRSAAAQSKTDKAFTAYCDFLLGEARGGDKKLAFDAYITLGCGN